MNMEGILGSGFMDRAESRRRDARIRDKEGGSRKRDSGPSFEAKKAILMQRIQEMREMATPGMSPAPMPLMAGQGEMRPAPMPSPMAQPGGMQPAPMPMQAGMMPSFPHIRDLIGLGQGRMPAQQPSPDYPLAPKGDMPGGPMVPGGDMPPLMPMAPRGDMPPPMPMAPRGDLGMRPGLGLLASTSPAPAPPMPQMPMAAPSLPFENAPEVAQGRFETFREAFKDARKSGKKTFMWNGKKYTTKIKK